MVEPVSFLGGRVVLHAGDCREAIKAIADGSIDACVSDPPYALVSIGKRFGKPGSAPAVHGKDGLYARASAGFMGKSWDTGEVAFDPEFWAEVLRVLKPGGHVVAFGGTRAYHRLACAIEDAGFEIRDQLAWAYGSGFPKSHDVSKGIAKRRDDSASIVLVTTFLAEAAQRAGKSRAQVDEHMGTSDMAGWWLTDLRHRCALPTLQQWVALKHFLDCGDEMDGEVVRLNARKGEHGEGWKEAPVIGEHDKTAQAAQWRAEYSQGIANSDRSIRDISECAEAAAWEDWGTALKPAWEPIVLARRSLDGTVAENVLEYGTGALNIGATRLAYKQNWPANILHDGGDEVAACLGLYSRDAARFFYSAKADADDRIGSKHPTVKPVDLMQWLCRLITPPGGTVLDPFAGTGTTGEAAFREGFSAVLIEREAEYRDDIARRMALAEAGPATRKAESAKARFGTLDAGPLFGGAEASGGGRTVYGQFANDKSGRSG